MIETKLSLKKQYICIHVQYKNSFGLYYFSLVWLWPKKKLNHTVNCKRFLEQPILSNEGNVFCSRFFFLIYTVQTDIWQVIHYLQDWQANHLIMPQKFEFTFNTEPKYVFYFSNMTTNLFHNLGVYLYL